MTVNGSQYKPDITTLVGKMLFLNKDINVNLNNLTEKLKFLNIDTLNIFYINDSENVSIFETNKFIDNNGSIINYIELGTNKFIEWLNNSNNDFTNYNNKSIYILKNGNYLEVKNMLIKINNLNTNLGRGGGQKTNILSPLDFRFSAYLMAICDLDYKLVSSLNAFNSLTKDKYVLYNTY